MNKPDNGLNATTVSSYSKAGASEYEDPMNKNFLYGQITVEFIDGIRFPQGCKTVLDIGCGTGFVFDELRGVFHDNGITGIGIEPAEGMLDIAREKYSNEANYSFLDGSFENIPLADKSVDKITSTLALHWVKSLPAAAAEMRRVLHDGGSLDILMIAKDDGAHFKKAIVAALREHLSFRQIMSTAGLVQRATVDDVSRAFSIFSDHFQVSVEEFRNVIHGTFDEHMKWWKARSSPVIAEIEDKQRFMLDLRRELEKTDMDAGIPFDTAYHWIKLAPG